VQRERSGPGSSGACPCVVPRTATRAEGHRHRKDVYQGVAPRLLPIVNALVERETRSLAVPAQNASADDPETARSADPTVWDVSAQAFRRWQAGDTAALDDLVRALTPVLWHVVRAVGLDQSAAEDVVQVTWLTLVRKKDSVHDPQAVASWLTTTARREAWRVSRTQVRMVPVADEVIERRTPDLNSAESHVIDTDEGNRLWACVQQLDARCQRLLRAVAFDHRPDYAGIADELSMPIGSIGPTRGRCLAKLKKLLAPSGDCDD